MHINKIPDDSYVLIIGAMKAGTSSLYNYLIQHPSICPCKIKEPEFFSSHQSHGSKIKDIRNYWELWDYDPQYHQVVIEASTGYTKYPMEDDVPKRIYELGIKPYFIYLVRNPFERIISHFNFRMVTPGFKIDQNLAHNEHLLNISRYYFQLEQFFQYFPEREKYLVIDSSLFFESPDKVVNQVLNFINIKNTYKFKFDFSKIKNKTAKLNSMELFLFRSNLISLSKLMPNRMNYLIKKTIKSLFGKPNNRLLTEEEYLVILDRLWDDMRMLHNEFGIDVGQWGFKFEDVNE